MTARNYDFILNVANSQGFVTSNVLMGASSGTGALIVNVDHRASTIKVKLANVYQEFIVGETINSLSSVFIQSDVTVEYNNTTPTAINGNNYIINGTANTFSLPNSNLTNFYKDSIFVTINGITLPKQAWVYPAITSLSSYGITLKPIVFTKTLDTDLANLKIKASEVIKSNFYNSQTWVPGSEIPDVTLSSTYQSQKVEDFSAIIPDSDLARIFVGNAAVVGNQTQFSYNLPTANISNLAVSLQYGDAQSAPFYPGYKASETVSATTTISSITNSNFIAEKNAFQQQPIVRLYTLYYPGEWYPPLPSGNPNSEDLSVSYPWPKGFPFKFAEVRGDFISDITYTVSFNGEEYIPYPINSTGIGLDSTGKINDISLTVSNFDNLITALVENSFLCGYNSDNNAPGMVNGEIVFNIDPRTNPANAHFDYSYSEEVGINVAWTYNTTQTMGDTWVPLKQDSRDLLGGVVEIKTTFANFLDYWPEYSVILEKVNGNYVKMRTTSPYRVGDVVHNDANTVANATSVITQIVHPYLVVNNAIALNPGDKLYIQNPDAGGDEYVKDNFKVNSLEGLDDSAAKFSLTSWLQYFKNVSPKRVFSKNTCLWPYKGEECQYPASGTGQIPGSSKTANGFFTINNLATADPTQDVCARNGVACDLRRNGIHFGAFTGTGISTPR